MTTRRGSRLFPLLLTLAIGLASGNAFARGEATRRAAVAARVTRATGSEESHYRRTTPGGNLVIRSRKGDAVRDRYVRPTGRIVSTKHDLVPRGTALVAAEFLRRDPGAVGIRVEFAGRYRGLAMGGRSPRGTYLRYFVTDGRPYQDGGAVLGLFLYDPATGDVRRDSTRF